MVERRLPPAGDADPTTPLPSIEQGSFMHLPSLWRSIRRSRGWMVGLPLVLVLLAAIWTWLQPRQYEGRTTLLIESTGAGGGGGLLAQQVAAITGMGAGRGTLETDLQLLQSRQVLRGVVDSLALRVIPREPADLPRGAVFARVAADTGGFAGRLHFAARGDGSYTLSVRDAPPLPRPPPTVVRAGEPIEVGGIRLELAALPPGEAPERIDLEVVSFRRMVQLFRDDLVVERTGTSSLVEVRARYPDPQLAALASDLLVERFIEYRRQTNREDAAGSVEFLEEQVADYAVELRDAEERLREFRERERLVSAPEQAARSVQRLSALDTQRAELAAQRTVLARLVETATAAAGEDRPSEFRRLAAFPEFFRNPAVQDILQSLVELENERAQVMVLRTAENADVRGLTERIEQLERQLLSTALDYLAGLDEQLAAIDVTLRSTSGEAERVPAVETEFMRLSREVEMLNEIHTLLQMRLKEQEVTAADRRTDVRLVDAALVPSRPVSPRPVLNLLLALIVGAMLGLGVAVVRAAVDPALYSRDVVAAVSGGVPILSSIPAGQRGAWALPAAGGRLRLPFGRTTLPAGDGGFIVAPGTPAAEAYASLRTRLINFTVPPPRVLLVASSRAGDGKSTVAANLAAAFARHGASTLLLEADLRRGDLNELLRLREPRSTLADVLAGGAEATEAIATITLPGGAESLDVLLAGRAARRPAALLESEAFGALIAELRARYDVIVLDTPPLQPVSDALLAGRHADGALLVTRAGATSRDALEAAIDELDRSGARVHGLVLNGFDRADATYEYGSA